MLRYTFNSNKILFEISINGKSIFFKMNNLSADSVLNRLQQALGAKSDSALSRALGVNRATLGNWRARDSVPYSICVNCSVDNDISLNWLLAGQGNMLFNLSGQSNEALNADRMRLIGLFDALSEEQQQEAIQLIAEKKRLNDLEKAVKDLQYKITYSFQT